MYCHNTCGVGLHNAHCSLDIGVNVCGCYAWKRASHIVEKNKHQAFDGTFAIIGYRNWHQTSEQLNSEKDNMERW